MRHPVQNTSTVAPPAPERRGAWRRGAAATFVVCALYAGTCAALWRVARRGADAFVIVPNAIDRTHAPSWLPPAEVARVNALGESVRGRSILDPDLTRDLAACYMESPWVSRVVHVRRAFPNRLEVGLAIRRPFAVVEAGGGLPAVLDRTGVRLPASAASSGFPRLAGVVSPRPPQGSVWEDVRVLDGLRVLGYYREVVDGDDLLAVTFPPKEVRVGEWSRADGRPVVEIVVGGSGFRVIWGVDMPAGQGTVTGPPAEVKLARLAAHLPRIAEIGRSPAYIDLRHKSGAVVRYDDEPPSGAQSAATGRAGREDG